MYPMNAAGAVLIAARGRPRGCRRHPGLLGRWSSTRSRTAPPWPHVQATGARLDLGAAPRCGQAAADRWPAGGVRARYGTHQAPARGDRRRRAIAAEFVLELGRGAGISNSPNQSVELPTSHQPALRHTTTSSPPSVMISATR